MADHPDRPVDAPVLAHRRAPAARLPQLRRGRRLPVRPHPGRHRPRPGRRHRRRPEPPAARPHRRLAGPDPVHLPVRLPSGGRQAERPAELSRGERAPARRPSDAGVQAGGRSPGPHVDRRRIAAGVPLHGQRLRRRPPHEVRDAHPDHLPDKAVRPGPLLHPGRPAPGPRPRRGVGGADDRPAGRPGRVDRRPPGAACAARAVVDAVPRRLLARYRPGPGGTGGVAGRLGPVRLVPPAARRVGPATGCR